MQGSKKDSDVKTDFLTMRESEGGMIWENSIEICILPYVKYDKIDFNAKK